MPEPPRIEDCTRVLIVEGHSDLFFYKELLKTLGNYDRVFIKHFNGKSDLTIKLEIFLNPQLLASKEAFGVIVDADTNAEGTAGSLTQVLKRVTGQTITQGTWTKGKPRVGLFITPDGKSNGEVETLVWRAWSADPLNAKPKYCIEEFVQCMASAEFRPQSADKGFVGALLAIRNDDDPRLGAGARAKVFDFNRPEFSPLKQFLSDL
jgi:hypothetical protein